MLNRNLLKALTPNRVLSRKSSSNYSRVLKMDWQYTIPENVENLVIQYVYSVSTH